MCFIIGAKAFTAAAAAEGVVLVSAERHRMPSNINARFIAVSPDNVIGDTVTGH